MTENSTRQIYIPICFYYFRLPSLLLFTHRIYLHSNMFLLFPPRRWITAAVKEHLHSNMFLLFRNFSSFKSPTNTHLHSNMFLLFRATAASSLAAFNSFTFQYVSIISICLFINIFQCFRFTFQYVSIIFGIIAIEKICEIHLHSNMFLLFLTGVSFHSGMGQIYIPICFYYFRTN